VVKKIDKAALILIAMVVVSWTVWRLFPSDETKIRRELQKLSELATFTGKEGNFKRVAAASRLADHFTVNAEIVVQVAGVDLQGLHGRAEIQQVALAGMARAGGVKVDLYDMVVKVAPDKLNATTELTAKITPTGERDFFLQELRFQMKKEDSQWLIDRVETMQTFK
jgi:hypothetical protein